MPGIEPGASRMRSARSTTELHPLVFHNLISGPSYFVFFMPDKIHYNKLLLRVAGRMAEWSKALVLGTSHFGGAGSNPAPVTF